MLWQALHTIGTSDVVLAALSQNKEQEQSTECHTPKTKDKRPIAGAFGPLVFIRLLISVILWHHI